MYRKVHASSEVLVVHSKVGEIRDDGGRRSGEALVSAEEVALYFGVATTTV